jgi:hypothetical protein
MLIQMINGVPPEDPTYRMQTQLVIRHSCRELAPGGPAAVAPSGSPSASEGADRKGVRARAARK